MLVSVIIPTLNEAETIQAAIKAARRDYPPDQVEIVVADGGSTDGTLDLVPEHATVDAAPRGRGVQMNRGAAVSGGQILVFCHADSQLPSGWREAVIDALADPQVSGGTFQTLMLPERGFLLWLRNHMVFTADWRGLYGDQVQFMRRETFERVGGFPEIPLMEDLEMSRALYQVGRLVRISPRLRVITSSRRFLERGVLRQWLLNVRNVIWYLYLGASPEDIASSYRSSREEALCADD